MGDEGKVNMAMKFNARNLWDGMVLTSFGIIGFSSYIIQNVNLPSEPLLYLSALAAIIGSASFIGRKLFDRKEKNG